jgi:hypothetical protein
MGVKSLSKLRRDFCTYPPLPLLCPFPLIKKLKIKKKNKKIIIIKILPHFNKQLKNNSRGIVLE